MRFLVAHTSLCRNDKQLIYNLLFKISFFIINRTQVNNLVEVTTKPIIFDGDTGGRIEHFVFTVRMLERLGVSAVVIGDKIDIQKNSLFGTDVLQHQDDIDNFCKKIEAGKQARITSDFMVIARIESLTLKAGMKDALKRAKAYVNSGADAIMIDSKEKYPNEIIEFCKKFRSTNKYTPIIVAPSSYNTIYERELIKIGVSVVIYANQLLRSAYPAMLDTAKSILKNGRSFESNGNCISIEKILELIRH